MDVLHFATTCMLITRVYHDSGFCIMEPLWSPFILQPEPGLQM